MLRRQQKTVIKLIFVAVVFVLSTCLCLSYLPSVITKSDKHEPFLAILVVSKADNEAQRQTIRDTWAKKLPESAVLRFAVADYSLSIRDEAARFGDLLIINNFVDSYERLTEKVLLSLSAICQETKFSFLLKCDDDTFVRVDKVIELIASKPKERLYMGYFRGTANVKTKGAWTESNWNLCDRYLPYAQGGGYILSYDLVEYINANSRVLRKFKSEDVSVGAWLAPLDTHSVHETSFDTEWKSRGCSNEHIVSHKQSTEMMHEKQRNLDKTGRLCELEVKERKTYKYNWSVLPSQCCTEFV